MKRLALGGQRVGVPLFAATASDDERLWPWKRGISPDAVLISYDVLKKRSERLSRPLSETLDFKGLTILDSGGYGASTETSAAAVLRLQRAVTANVGITLDRVALTTDAPRTQRIAVAQTVRNARAARRYHGQMALEAVVQGATPKQLADCSRQLGKLDFEVYGVPVSMQSKYRRYRAAVERVAYATSGLPRKAPIHALGCGSRTLMAILSAVGVKLFDSRSYYQRALYGENIRSVTMCALGKPLGKKECATCLKQHPPGRTPAARADHNLHEIQKEICRIRCALENSATDEYLQRRLSKSLLHDLASTIEQFAAIRSRADV
jgi:queuine/archaeosine tRNA-ribosyltransferase